jgi:uncharacterized protein (TIGR03545 family)
MNMKRWSYLIPRAAIAALILISIWLGRDPIIRRVLVYQTQSVTGAKAEIGQVRSSLPGGKIFLKDVRIADPREPMKNLLQADMAYVQLQLKPLLWRRFVIENGQANQLMFGVPRTESGLLTTASTPNYAQLKPEKLRDFESEVAEIGQAWLDQLQPIPATTGTQSLTQSLVIPQMLATSNGQLIEKFSAQLTAYRGQIAELNPNLNAIRQSLATGYQNPLRDPKRYAVSAEELAAVNKQSLDLKNALADLQKSVNEEKEKWQTAQQHDVQQLQHLPEAIPFDAESATELLLHQPEGELVDEAVRWFRWFRSSIPNPSKFNGPHHTGSDIAFDNATQAPNLLIKSLDIEGEGRFAGQHMEFAGTIFDLASEPQRHPKPVTIDLRAQGKQHVNIHCQLDRRGENAIDTLTIQCPNLPWPTKTLGEPRSLLVSVGPASRLNAEIDIRIDGDELSGTMTFRHSNVALHVDRLNDLAGGASTAVLINQNVSVINRFMTTVQLTGTLDDYQYQFESDLGKQLSAAVESTTTTQTNQMAQRRSEEIKQIVTEKIRKLDQDLNGAIDELQLQLNQEIHRTAKLKSLIESPTNQSWPKIR